MDDGEPMLCYIVLETNESPMLRGRGEARLEVVARERARCAWGGEGGGEGEKLLSLFHQNFSHVFDG